MWSCQSRLVWSSRKLCWTLCRLSDFSPETTRQRIKCMHCDLMNQGGNPANWPTRLREDIQLNTASPSVQSPPKRNSQGLYLSAPALSFRPDCASILLSASVDCLNREPETAVDHENGGRENPRHSVLPISFRGSSLGTPCTQGSRLACVNGDDTIGGRSLRAVCSRAGAPEQDKIQIYATQT